MNKPFEVRLVRCGGWFVRSDGKIMLRLANPELPASGINTDYQVWAADMENGCICKMNPYEMVYAYYTGARISYI